MRFFDLLRASRGATHTLTDRPVAHKACTWRVGDGVAGLAGRPCHRRLFLRRGQMGPSKSVIAAGAAKCWTDQLAGMLMIRSPVELPRAPGATGSYLPVVKDFKI